MEIDFYDIAKIIHITAVICWMVGLLYLPRIFLYHTKIDKNNQAYQIFLTMENRLWKFIMTPAMLVTIAFGAYMSFEIGLQFIWLHIKISLVFLLIIYHFYLRKIYFNFTKFENLHSEKFFKIINEIPTLLMILIIILIILKPF